jgi:hypothetical protein
MLGGYVSAGFDPARFWQLTPRLYAAEMAGARMRLEREAKDRIELSWMTANLSRAEKLPALHELLNEKKEDHAQKQQDVHMRLKQMAAGMTRKSWSEWVKQ